MLKQDSVDPINPNLLTRAAWVAGCLIVALLLQAAIMPYTGGVVPFATFYAAVAIAALKAGRTGGFIALASAAVLTPFFLMKPYLVLGPLSRDDAVRLALFAFNGSIIVMICGRYGAMVERLRRSDETSKRTSNLLEAIGNASPDLIYAKDLNFRTIYANAATLKVLGVPEAEVFGRTAAEYASQTEEGERHAANDLRVIETGDIYVAEEEFTSPDGTLRVFRSTKAPLRNAAGEIVGIAGVSVDITQERRTLEALQASESRLRLALEAGRMAVWEHDIATDTLISSPELNRLFGAPEGEDLKIEDIRARYLPGERERLVEIAQGALERGDRQFDAEFQLYSPEGEPRWYLLRAQFGPDPLAGRITGVVLDITGPKQVEQALAEREAELKAALDAGALTVVDFDHRTGRFAHSPGLNELYGYPADHQLTLEDVRARYHPDIVSEVYARKKSDDETIETRNFDWTLKLLLPDGRTRWVEGLGEYIRDEAGRIIRSRGVVLDVTERKRWEEHQRLLINELNHRVKNTLAIVQSLAQQTFRGRGGDPDREAFEVRLLALSRAHDILTQQNWQSAHLSDLVEAAAAQTLGGMRSRFHASGPDVLLQPQTAVSLAMALHELCTNAIKYGALSGDQGDVHVAWQVLDSAENAQLRLTWTEEGGPPVVEPQKPGFGSRMIQRALASDLNGKVSLEFRPEGVVCTIEAPLPTIEILTEAA